jgi:hypothetical protein
MAVSLGFSMHDRIVHSWYAALRRDDVMAITFRRFLRRRVSSERSAVQMLAKTWDRNRPSSAAAN